MLNKDLIQFAHRSSKVRKMLIDGERVEAIPGIDGRSSFDYYRTVG